MKTPKTLLDAVRYFSDLKVALVDDADFDWLNQHQ